MTHQPKREWEQELMDLFGFNGYEGTYWHILTRVKESRHIGTMSLDDFEEVTEESLLDLKAFIQKVEDEAIRRTVMKVREEIQRYVAQEIYWDRMGKDQFSKGAANATENIEIGILALPSLTITKK